MYHAHVLEDLLDLINVSRVSPAGAELEPARHFEPLVPRMFAWLRIMTHPDGEIALFNDAALGIAAAPGALCAYATRLGIAPATPPLRALEHLRDSGYVRLQAGPAALIADVGEVGPAHLTGHAHADTLSFELSLGRERVLVDSGTSRYGDSDERTRQRSTSAHNTLEIDGESSSEVWGAFRTGRRAHPFGLDLSQDGERLSLRCSHDGYGHRRGRPVHERRLNLHASGLELIDRVHGPFGRARSSLHIAPAVGAALEAGGSRGRLEVPGGPGVAVEIRRGTARLEASTYHPRFGTSLQNQVLRIELDGPECAVRLHWS
jgi:uncharacterized heparinase superfamily protein